MPFTEAGASGEGEALGGEVSMPLSSRCLRDTTEKRIKQ